LTTAGIPLLDSHNQFGINNLLGKITSAWFEGGALLGQIKFNRTEQGRKAEKMVSRGEVTGVSAGYRVLQWRVTDSDGDDVDPGRARWDDDLTYTATRWELLEASLVSVPADASATIRSMGVRSILIENVRARMLARHAMHARMRRRG
jgi:HK97 family phage prohead protease